MGAREEESGNVVKGPPIMGEPWWQINRIDGVWICSHMAPSWFAAREIGQTINEGEPVVVGLVLTRSGNARSL